MKKLFTITTALFLSVAVMAQTKVDDVAKFNTENHSFGKIKQGVPVTYNFEIKNISDKPLVVENASASCGCTVPEKPEQPIAPGKSANLKVVYNAAVAGPINKEVYVKFAGIDVQKVLHITGEVVAEQQTQQAQPTKSTPIKPLPSKGN
ncbi:MAG: DUF1573 domain-containing protein [Sphingobacteriales bacterium]|jgi:hypothetical protein|nr:DUF1573 domain-containing protein [Sphingobacteriales bacterium]MBP7556537.1 DUF1573 domain-containing protein [Chitinophagaceae bacterium]NCT76489.1 DUF1573 domain-containing protein [Chitinophagaceae bacterium]OJW33619.1 MAG: hypothetical protein BGO54_10260 [Sphingobacteriales bacterium 46-32]